MKIIIFVLIISYLQLSANNIDSIPRSFTYRSEIKPLTKVQNIDIKLLQELNNDSLRYEENSIKLKHSTIPDIYGIEQVVNFTNKNSGTSDTLENNWLRGFEAHLGIGIGTGNHIGIRISPIEKLTIKLEYGNNLYLFFLGGPTEFKIKNIIGIEYFTSKHINIGCNSIYTKCTIPNQKDIDIGFPTISWFSSNKGLFYMFSAGLAFNVWNNGSSNLKFINFAGPVIEFNVGYKFNF